MSVRVDPHTSLHHPKTSTVVFSIVPASNNKAIVGYILTVTLKKSTFI